MSPYGTRILRNDIKTCNMEALLRHRFSTASVGQTHWISGPVCVVRLALDKPINPFATIAPCIKSPPWHRLGLAGSASGRPLCPSSMFWTHPTSSKAISRTQPAKVLKKAAGAFGNGLPPRAAPALRVHQRCCKERRQGALLNCSVICPALCVPPGSYRDNPAMQTFSIIRLSAICIQCTLASDHSQDLARIIHEFGNSWALRGI
jgi:hypothetical protein